MMMTKNLSDRQQRQSSSSSSTMQSSIASSWSGCHINWRSCYFERPWVTDVPQQSSHKAVGGSGKSIVDALFRSLGVMEESQSSSQQMGACILQDEQLQLLQQNSSSVMISVVPTNGAHAPVVYPDKFSPKTDQSTYCASKKFSRCFRFLQTLATHGDATTDDFQGMNNLFSNS